MKNQPRIRYFLVDWFTRRFRREHLFTVLLLCFSTAAGLLLCETVLRFALPNKYQIWTPHLQRVFRPHEDTMPGISGESRFIANSRGIRGDEFRSSDTYRILTIGGSTTECLYLDQAETWPYLLQENLNENAPDHRVWVGNAGMSGKNTRHHLTAIQYLPLAEMKIDAIVLLIGINDFSNRFRNEESYDPDFLAQPKATASLISETFVGGDYPDPYDPFFKRTALWMKLRKVWRRFFGGTYYTQDEAGEKYVTWRQHRQQAVEIRNELPDLSSALVEYASNINKMIDAAQQKSVRLIFVTQPTMWKAGLSEDLDALLWFGGVGDFQRESGHAYYSSEVLEKGIKRYNDTLLTICQERQVECVDLSSLLEKDTTVFYDDCHFNESGARKVSRILSDSLLSQESGVFLSKGAEPAILLSK